MSNKYVKGGSISKFWEIEQYIKMRLELSEKYNSISYEDDLSDHNTKFNSIKSHSDISKDFEID